MKYGRIARALALTCLLFNASPPAAGSAAPDENAVDQSSRAEASALHSVAAALDRAAAVGKVPSASVAPTVSPALHAWLAAGLAAARKEKTAAARSADIRALAASSRVGAELSVRPPATSPRNLAADVRVVLAEPAFHVNVNSGPATKKPASWLERIVQSFLEWWAQLMGRLIAVAVGSAAFGNLAAVVLIAAAAVALAFLVFRVAMFLVARRARERGSSAAAGTPLTVHASVDETRDAARAAARSGSYELAIALLFEAALLALDRSGHVPYDSARTAGEYRRAVRRSIAGESGAFEKLVRAFTYVAYAQAPAGESDWRAADAAFASMHFTAAGRP